jgi:hypothetical protein
MGNAIDKQDDSVAYVVVTVAAVAVFVREEGSNSDAGAYFSSGKISTEEDIQAHWILLAARPTNGEECTKPCFRDVFIWMQHASQKYFY